jgi:hypothetical protein
MAALPRDITRIAGGRPSYRNSRSQYRVQLDRPDSEFALATFRFAGLSEVVDLIGLSTDI